MESAADLYARVAGAEAWAVLPLVVRRCHTASPTGAAEGSFHISRGPSWLAGIVARLAGLPPPGRDVATRLAVRVVDGAQRWQRSFAGRPLHSTQYLTSDGWLAERRGPLELHLALSVVGGELHLCAEHARLCLGPLRMPLAGWMRPEVRARAWAAPGETAMQVDVRISAAIVGLVLRYEGRIEPAGEP